MTDTPGPEKAVYEHLDKLGVLYEKLDCEPDFADTANFCKQYGFPPENSANTIVVATKKEPKKYCVCVVTASTRLDVNKTVRKLLGGPKCSFASADETKDLTGMLIGGVTPFALPADLPVFVDERIMALEYIILGGGGRSSKVRIAPEIFRRLSNARIIPGLGMEPRS